MVFQAFNLMPTLNVLENASLPGLLAGKKPAVVKEKALELLDWLGLSRRGEHLPAQLSGGEMQRTAIARALINDPAIILADEPTGNLDRETGALVMDLLFELQKEHGTTLVLVTHDEALASRCHRSVKMIDGLLKEESGDLC